jgi:hypothetical protein
MIDVEVIVKTRFVQRTQKLNEDLEKRYIREGRIEGSLLLF